MIEKKKMKTVSKYILIVYNVKIIKHLKQSFLIILKFIVNENSQKEDNLIFYFNKYLISCIQFKENQKFDK